MVDSVKRAQIVPVSGIVLLVKHLLPRFFFLPKQLRVVDIVYAQTLKLRFKFLYPAVVVTDSVCQIFGIYRRLFRVKHKEEGNAALLAIALYLRKHLCKSKMIVGKNDVAFRLGKNISVLSVFIQRVNHLVKHSVADIIFQTGS